MANQPQFPIGSSPYNGIGFDPFHKGTAFVLSFDRETCVGGGGRGIVLTSKGFSSSSTINKAYCEFLINSGVASNIGVASYAAPINPVAGGASGDLGADTVGGGFGWGFISHGGPFKQHNNVQTGIGSAYGSGDILCVALDMVNGYIYYRRNNLAWMNSGDPTSGAAGTGAFFTGLTGTLYFAVSNDGGNASSYTMNSGGGAGFTYTPPAGYSGF